MVSFLLGIAAGIVVLGVLCWCAARGIRDRHRPGDAEASAVLRGSGQPDEPGRLRLHRLRVAGGPLTAGTRLPV